MEVLGQPGWVFKCLGPGVLGGVEEGGAEQVPECAVANSPHPRPSLHAGNRFETKQIARSSVSSCTWMLTSIEDFPLQVIAVVFASFHFSTFIIPSTLSK